MDSANLYLFMNLFLGITILKFIGIHMSVNKFQEIRTVARVRMTLNMWAFTKNVA